MVGQCSVAAVGYGGAACNGIKTALSGTPNEKFIETLSKFALQQFDELTSSFPLVPPANQKFAMAHADHSANFSPSAVTGISGHGGHSLA